MGRKIVAVFIVLSTVCSLVHLSFEQGCNVADGSRQDCGWLGIINSTCIGRGCCWVSSKTSGIPWCFYNSSLSSILKSTKVCEHTGPAKLECSETERVDVFDAFYGRNGDDGSCHGHSSMTCFHPNATDIVRNICKMNSTCNVPSFGDFWNFRKDCDDLNAQLKVHYICVPKGPSVSPSSPSRVSSTTKIYQSSDSQTSAFELMTSPSSSLFIEETSLDSSSEVFTLTQTDWKASSSISMQEMMSSAFEAQSSSSFADTSPSSPAASAPFMSTTDAGFITPSLSDSYTSKISASPGMSYHAIATTATTTTAATIAEATSTTTTKMATTAMATSTTATTTSTGRSSSSAGSMILTTKIQTTISSNRIARSSMKTGSWAAVSSVFGTLKPSSTVPKSSAKQTPLHSDHIVPTTSSASLGMSSSVTVQARKNKPAGASKRQALIVGGAAGGCLLLIIIIIAAIVVAKKRPCQSSYRSDLLTDHLYVMSAGSDEQLSMKELDKS